MQFTHKHVFDASLDRVIAMFADEEFARRRAHISAADTDGAAAESSAIVDGTADGAFTISIRRTVPTSSIPSEFRSFVGSELHVRYHEAWQAPSGDDRVASFAVEIVGTPGHVAGAIGLTPQGDSTEMLATGDVKVTIPLIGGMIERAVADAVVKGLADELAAADAWLAE